MKFFLKEGKFLRFFRKYILTGIRKLISSSCRGIVDIVGKLKNKVTTKFLVKARVDSRQLLKEAWERNDMEVVLNLSKNIDITILNENCDLIEACEVGNLEAVELLLDMGEDINERKIKFNEDGNICVINPLIIACQKGNEQLAKYLINNGADVNKECYNVGTPLYVALNSKNLQLTKLLVENFADINIMKEKDGENKELMQKLFKELSLNIVTRIMVQEKDIDGFNECLKLLNYEIILGQREINTNNKMNTFIENIKQEISNNEDCDISKEMLCAVKQFENKKIDLDKSMADLLVEACIEQDICGVDFLLMEKCVNANSSNKDGVTPLVAACYVGNMPIVKRLLDYGANIDKEGCVYNKKLSKIVCEGTPLIVAIKRRRNDIVNMLIANKANINKRYGLGKTALIYAVEDENEEVVKTLINRGANVNIVPMDRNTALITAVRRGNKCIVKYLLENNANINEKLHDGRTILNIAIANRDRGLVGLLIDNFVDLDVLDEERKGNNREFVESILESGHIRFSVRFGDFDMLRRQLEQYMRDKSDEYISKLEEEIKGIADCGISNDMIEMIYSYRGKFFEKNTNYSDENILVGEIKIEKNKGNKNLMIA